MTVLGLLVVLGLCGSVERADARVAWQQGVASVFDARAEPALGCWPWKPRYLPRGALVVAHKSLPCGSRVRFCYRGRCVTAVVRDRGPYVAGREWDLDVAVMRALHFPFGVLGVNWRIP